jgi:hypothetical protein
LVIRYLFSRFIHCYPKITKVQSSLQLSFFFISLLSTHIVGASKWLRTLGMSLWQRITTNTYKTSSFCSIPHAKSDRTVNMCPELSMYEPKTFAVIFILIVLSLIRIINSKDCNKQTNSNIQVSWLTWN